MTTTLPWLHPARAQALLDALTQRILVIDGAMGTMLQGYRLDEGGYRGERFAHGFDARHAAAHDHSHHVCDLKGNNDLLLLTQPEIIRAVHRQYLDAGADLIETNTFNATAISQADYHLEHLVYELNLPARALRASAATPPRRRRRSSHASLSACSARPAAPPPSVPMSTIPVSATPASTSSPLPTAKPRAVSSTVAPTC